MFSHRRKNFAPTFSMRLTSKSVFGVFQASPWRTPVGLTHLSCPGEECLDQFVPISSLHSAGAKTPSFAKCGLRYSVGLLSWEVWFKVETRTCCLSTRNGCIKLCALFGSDNTLEHASVLSTCLLNVQHILCCVLLDATALARDVFNQCTKQVRQVERVGV